MAIFSVKYEQKRCVMSRNYPLLHPEFNESNNCVYFFQHNKRNVSSKRIRCCVTVYIM